ncbi:MAG: hypothetical protein OHK0024_12560 [Thalassobaculales bacterium]
MSLRDGDTPLIDAAQRGDRAALARLLAEGADPGASNDFGNTALMLAAARGDLEMVERLVAAGARPGQANKWGLTAQDWAKWPANAADVIARLTTK